MMARRIASLAFALLILCALPLMAAAHDVPQERDDCTIELQVWYQDTPISSGNLTAVLVGYMDEEDGDYFFRRVFTGERLENAYVQTTDAPKDMLEFYNANKSKFDFAHKKNPIQKGVCKFETMSTGLYLIIQERASTGYSKLSPFLVSVPYMEDGTYRYSVTAKLKTELEKEPQPTKPTPIPPGKLPQTGQLNWPVPVLALCGLGFLACGCLTQLSGKGKQNAQMDR